MRRKKLRGRANKTSNEIKKGERNRKSKGQQTKQPMNSTGKGMGEPIKKRNATRNREPNQHR